MGGKGRGLGQDGSNRPIFNGGGLGCVDNHLHSQEVSPIFALYPQIFPSLARK